MNKGFSLVELIVVIAIMAILVGVAVPVYTSYIEKANTNVEKQYLDELERAINTAAIDVKSGLTDTTATDDVVPTSVVINNGSVEAKNGSDDANAFEEILGALIDLEADGKTHTFTLNAKGVVTGVVTTVND